MNSKTLSIFIGITVIALSTAAVTYYAGSLTGRWGMFQGLGEVRNVLKTLPLEIGDWEAAKENVLDETSVNMLQIQDSYVFRSYKNKLTQETVYFTLMAGPSGKVTAHTPEICFGGKDYTKDSAPVPITFDTQLISGKDVVNTFWKIDFTGRSLDTNNRISFYYAVSAGDVWNAVENPRMTFQRYRFVYKIQVESFSSPESEQDTVQKFLTECLPTIHSHMKPCR